MTTAPKRSQRFLFLGHNVPAGLSAELAEALAVGMEELRRRDRSSFSPEAFALRDDWLATRELERRREQPVVAPVVAATGAKGPSVKIESGCWFPEEVDVAEAARRTGRLRSSITRSIRREILPARFDDRTRKWLIRTEDLGVED